MNRKEALKILGFSEDDNPQQWEVNERYKEKLLFTLCQNESREKILDQLKELRTAFNFLSEQFYGPAPKSFGYVNLDDDINSLSNLQSVLLRAVHQEDIKLLKEIFSKFKSSKSGQFGDYINKPDVGHSPLSYAILFKNTEIIELFLKNGADPNIEIGEFLLRDSKIKKLLVEYGRIDKSSIFVQLTFAFLAGCMALAIYSSCDASFVCYAGVAAFALAGVLLVAKAIHDVFYVQTKWPSPNFDEVNAEQVINSQEQGAAGSSRNVWV